MGCSFRDFSNPVRLIHPIPFHQPVVQLSPRILRADSSEIRDRAELRRVGTFSSFSSSSSRIICCFDRSIISSTKRRTDSDSFVWFDWYVHSVAIDDMLRVETGSLDAVSTLISESSENLSLVSIVTCSVRFTGWGTRAD